VKIEHEVKNMINKILVALDGSAHADKALDYALDIAEKYNASIQLLTVIPEVSVFTTRVYPAAGQVPLGVGDYHQDLKEHGEKMITAAQREAKQMKPQLQISTKVMEGHRIATDIINVAKDGAFDLIVIGSRGLHGVTGFLLGNVADRVADHAE
jgi:nucleotide-binding universal stress UspA family protein